MEIKKIWAFFIEEIYGWEARDVFLQDPEKIFEKKSKDNTLTSYEIEALKRYESLLYKAGLKRVKVLGFTIKGNTAADEEKCVGCEKMKDIGKKCWWCGGC